MPRRLDAQGRAILDDDIVLAQEGQPVGTASSVAKLTTGCGSSHGEVPFVFSSALGTTRRREFLDAMALWTNATKGRDRFVQRTRGMARAVRSGIVSTMGFRDDDHAARARADALERELADREAELAAREAELETARRALAQRDSASTRGKAKTEGDQPRASEADVEKRERRRVRRWRAGWVIALLVGVMVVDIVVWSALVVPARCRSLCDADRMTYGRLEIETDPVHYGCLCRQATGALVRSQRDDILLSSWFQYLRMLALSALVLGGGLWFTRRTKARRHS